jgi:dolichol-phosphate mannosyltransferase
MNPLTPERIRFVRFCAVGGSGVVVNLAIFSLCMDWLLLSALGAEETRFVLSNVAGFVVSVCTNFLLNDFWTWGDRQKRGHRHFMGRLSKFYLVSSLAGIVQIGVAYFTRAHLGVFDHGAVMIGIGVATLINYVANNLWTFRNKTQAADE